MNTWMTTKFRVVIKIQETLDGGRWNNNLSSPNFVSAFQKAILNKEVSFRQAVSELVWICRILGDKVFGSVVFVLRS